MRSKRIVFFNHKGGVSKTTSAYNIGWMLAQKGHRVLVVDADPQCNLSNLILGDNFEKYYVDDNTRLQNIKDGVSAAFDGKPVPISAVECQSPARAAELFLLAGHANLSEYDAALTFAQTSNNAIATLQNLPGAFSELIRLTEEKYETEYTLIDLNPSLSAINQNLFLISDGFVVPTNPDPFSIMAIDTLAKTLPKWAIWKQNALPLFEDSAYPLPVGIPRFVGTLIQRFNIRRGKAAKPYRDNIQEIREKITNDAFPKWSRVGMTFPDAHYIQLSQNNYCLGEVPDFQGLLPKSYDAGVPVFAIQNNEIAEAGNVLTNFIEKRDSFSAQFNEICDKIIDVMRDE